MTHSLVHTPHLNQHTLESKYFYSQFYLARIPVLKQQNMNILAFLFHTFLEFTDGKYKDLRRKLGARKRFFEHVRALTCYVCFRNWDRMMDFMIESYDNQIAPEDLAKYSA